MLAPLISGAFYFKVFCSSIRSVDMKKKRFFILSTLLLSFTLHANETGTLLLKAVVLPKISLSLDRTKREGNRSVISLVAKSNTYKFENNHHVEIENPLGLDLKTEVFEMDGKSSQKEYRVTVGKSSDTNVKNPFFTVKISAN